MLGPKGRGSTSGVGRAGQGLGSLPIRMCKPRASVSRTAPRSAQAPPYLDNLEFCRPPCLFCLRGVLAPHHLRLVLSPCLLHRLQSDVGMTKIEMEWGLGGLGEGHTKVKASWSRALSSRVHLGLLHLVSDCEVLSLRRARRLGCGVLGVDSPLREALSFATTAWDFSFLTLPLWLQKSSRMAASFGGSDSHPWQKAPW